MDYIITVKIPKRTDHNPRNKKTGTCPVNGGTCTDVTGEHHSFLFEYNGTTQEVQRFLEAKYYHVTRVEKLRGTTSPRAEDF